MDVEWALIELQTFVSLTTLVKLPRTPGIVNLGDDRRLGGTPDAIVEAAQIIEQILDQVLPNWRSSVPKDPLNRWQQERQAAQRAIVQLQRQAEIRERLGDNAPHLDAGQMHPWVWEGARSLWQSGHYQEAVRAASVKVNAETQNRLGRRDISETALFQAAYNKDAPKPGVPRLRLPDDDGGLTALSVRRGVMALAEGCYAALRNPLSHEVVGDLPEVEALEQLAAFSLLARFVARSSVVNLEN